MDSVFFQEMLGHPWHVAVASVDGEVWEDEIEGAFLWHTLKKGRAFSMRK